MNISELLFVLVCLIVVPLAFRLGSFLRSIIDGTSGDNNKYNPSSFANRVNDSRNWEDHEWK